METPTKSTETISSGPENDPKPQIREYKLLLKMLGDNSSITYNYALKKTVCLLESLVGREDTKNDLAVMDFVSEVATCLSERRWTHYGNSAARLELILRTMSSVLHMLLQCDVTKVEKDVRALLYKSISKFWIIYRNTDSINANTMFALREIRTCLRKIKDDQLYSHEIINKGGEVIDVVLNVLEKQYWSAFISLTKVLDFEYTAGKWFNKWEKKRETYFMLRQKYLHGTFESNERNEIHRFYRKLFKSSTKEFGKVIKKNTTYRNFEYKVLKSGGALAGFSLPDHIDTLLIGYLDLIQRLLEEFFIQLNDQIGRTVNFCEQIVEAVVKKQLTFKAVEILHLIKDMSDRKVKYEMESKFEFWSNPTLMTLPPQHNEILTSNPPSFNFVPPSLSDFNINKSSLQPKSSELYITPIPFSSSSSTSSEFDKTPFQLDTPTSAYSSSTTQPQSPLTQLRKLNVRKIMISLKDSQKFRQEHLINTHKDIIDDVKQLFDERNSVDENIKAIEEEYCKLSDSSNIKTNDPIDLDLFLSKLTASLKENDEKRKSIIGEDARSAHSQESNDWKDEKNITEENLYEKNEKRQHEIGEEVIINDDYDVKLPEDSLENEKNAIKENLDVKNEEELLENDLDKKDEKELLENEKNATEENLDVKNEEELPENDLDKKDEKELLENEKNATEENLDVRNEKELLESDLDKKDEKELLENNLDKKNEKGLPESDLDKKNEEEQSEIENIENNSHDLKLPNNNQGENGTEELTNVNRSSSISESPRFVITGPKIIVEENKSNVETIRNIETIQSIQNDVINNISNLNPSDQDDQDLTYFLKTFRRIAEKVEHLMRRADVGRQDALNYQVALDNSLKAYSYHSNNTSTTSFNSVNEKVIEAS